MHSLCLAAVLAGMPVEDFTLRDARGAERKLSDWTDRKVVVLAFLGCECPLATLYAPRLAGLARVYESQGVAFVGINPNAQDGVREIIRFAETHELSFPILKDAGALLADRLHVSRTPEVLVLDRARVVRYRGRIDDQYGVGTQRTRATRHDLAEALEDMLHERPVRVPLTEAAGCLIGRADRAVTGRGVTYSRDVAPIIQNRCQSCHRPGEVAPFALSTYDEVSVWGDMIGEVVRQGRMPPWHADPRHGKFANDPSLTPREKKTIAAWVEAGCPEGDRADLPPPRRFPEVWALGKPDLVVSMPEPFHVPASGVIEYQEIEVDPGFATDVWVRGVEVRPGNRAVVHHCNVFLKPPGAKDVMSLGRLGSYCLAATAVGTPPTMLPAGMAKRIPAGWRLVFVLHYTPTGSPQIDQTSVGLWLAEPSAVRQEVATCLMYDPDLSIPPRVASHRVEQTWLAREDVLLLAFFPHMHLRGRSFRYEAEYADGKVEVLLDVPRYAFNWQNRYELAEPKRLPAGTLIRCVAVYDNSAENLANPDPDAEVRAGKQTWDEMFNGYFDVALADQDLTRPEPMLTRAGRQLAHPIVLIPVLAALGLTLWASRRCRTA